MPRGVPHSAEVRAAAESLLLAGHSQAAVCEQTGLPKQTVCDIAGALGDRFGQVRTKKLESDADLIMGYFRAALRAMTAQAELFGDPSYTRSQNVRDLAIAHGIIGDKLAGIASTAQALGLIDSGEVQIYPELPSGQPTGEDVDTA